MAQTKKFLNNLIDNYSHLWYYLCNKENFKWVGVMDNLEIEYLTSNQYKKYEIELLTIFNENFLKNGGMLYSDDFLINSDSIIIAKMNQSVVAYMAITSNIEKELDREH